MEDWYTTVIQRCDLEEMKEIESAKWLKPEILAELRDKLNPRILSAAAIVVLEKTIRSQRPTFLVFILFLQRELYDISNMSIRYFHNSYTCSIHSIFLHLRLQMIQ